MLKFKFAFLYIMFFVPLITVGQELTKEIQIISEETKQPIVFAYYVYGTQKGITNEQGLIRIQYLPGETFTLSHVGFGKKVISSKIIQLAFEMGVLYVLPGVPMSLQPVTIIALQHQNSSVALNESERLSHDAGAVLTSTPSISAIKKSGSYGFDPVLRGFKYDQLSIVIDGLQSAAAACPNRMDPPASHIPLNQMDKVEIHKGPHALRYGPAFGGVINFISQQPNFDLGNKTTGRFSTAYESNGGLYRMEGALNTVKDNLALSVRGAWSQGNDYEDGEGIEVPAQFKRGNIGIQGVYLIADNQKIDLSINRNFARDVEFAGLPMDLVSDDTWLLRIDHTINYNKKINTWTTSGFVSIVDHMMDNMAKNLDPRMVNAKTPATTKTYGARSEINFNRKTTWTYLGGDFKVDEASGYRTREFLMGPNAGTTVVDNAWQNAGISRLGFFAEHHMELGQYHLIASGRLDVDHAALKDVATEYEDIQGKEGVVQINPSFSMGVHKDLTSDIALGLWIGRGQRSGSISERFINFFPVGLDPYELVGNINLKPEANNQMDLNVGLKKKLFKLHINLFSSWLQDYISSEIRSDLSPRLPASPGVRMFTNIGHARISGFEMSWSQVWPLNIQHQLDAAYLYGKNLERNEPLPEIPPCDGRIRIWGKYLNNKLLPEISFRRVWSQKRTSPNFGETQSPSFSIFGTKVSYVLERHVKISGGVENLLDKTYYEHLNRRFLNSERNIYAPGRNFYMSLSYDLGQ